MLIRWNAILVRLSQELIKPDDGISKGFKKEVTYLVSSLLLFKYNAEFTIY